MCHRRQAKKIPEELKKKKKKKKKKRERTNHKEQIGNTGDASVGGNSGLGGAQEHRMDTEHWEHG